MPSWESGAYRVEGNEIVLERVAYDGEPYETRYRQLQGVRAVFFDDPDGEGVEVEALSVDGDLNYAWCRVYPRAGR